MRKKVAIYARISQASEQSVSVDRQVATCRKYAEAHEWDVLETYVDEGTSATSLRIHERPAWSRFAAHADNFDVLLVWKLDRLSRRNADFWNVAEELEERGVRLVAVEDQIDMTTQAGQLIASVLAGLGRAEAQSTSARVKAARRYLLGQGRSPGGAPPYGWITVDNPEGPGKVLAHDPDRIDWVRGMADRVRRGDSIYSVVQWLDESSAPYALTSQARRRSTGWRYSSVERLLRNPILGGMIAYEPAVSKKEARARGPRTHDRRRVLLGPDNTPIVRPEIGIMTPNEWHAMLDALDARDSAQSKPVAQRARTSSLLSGLVWCREHERRMWRGTIGGRPGYYCPERPCQSASNFEELIVERFLEEKGPWQRRPFVASSEETESRLPLIARRIAEVTTELASSEDEELDEKLSTQLADLKAQRRRLRDEEKERGPVYVEVEDGPTFAEEWEAADTPEDRRVVLDGAIERVWVSRRPPAGPGVDPDRFEIQWRDPERLGPIPEPTDEELAAVADHNPVAPRRRRPGPPESED